MRKLRKLLGRSTRQRRVAAFSPSVAGAAVLNAPKRRKRRATKGGSGLRAGALVGLTLGFLPYLAAAVVAASLPLFGYHLYVEVMSSPHLSIQEIEVVGYIKAKELNAMLQELAETKETEREA